MGQARPRRRTVAFPRRGEVYLVDFDPVVGSEIAKRRPALVIQNDVGNRVSPITIVAAFSSQVQPPIYPIEVLVRAPEGGLTNDSTVRLNPRLDAPSRWLLVDDGRAEPALCLEANREAAY